MLYNWRVPIRLDHSSPVPLYHQLAERLRAQIEAGALAPGEALPPLRQAAEKWGVNLHTVRHAYQRLATAGLVRTTAPHGTVVLGAAPARTPAAPVTADAFVARLLREAEQHGLTADDLRRRLLSADADTARKHVDVAPPPARVITPAHAAPGVRPTTPASSTPAHGPVAVPARATSDVVHVVECSTSQAIDLARQVEERWQVSAKPWSLERAGEPPVGPLVATFFHYNDIRGRWPKRLGQVQFVGIHPDPALADRIRAVAPAESRTTVILCERDAAKAREVAADLASVLPTPAFEIRTMVSANPSTALHMAARTQAVLFTPRVWGALGPAERADPRAIEVRYLFDASEIEAVAERLHWHAR